jgi:hypothetical protein
VTDKVWGPEHRVLVSGSRDFTDSNVVSETLMGAYEMHSIGWLTIHIRPFVVVHGAARGADTFAHDWCVATGPHPGPDFDQDHAPPVVEDPHPADWDKYRPADPSKKNPAGAIRNREMLASGIDVAYIFVNKPLKQSRGSKDMWDLCQEAGIRSYAIYAPHAVRKEPDEAQKRLTGI